MVAAIFEITQVQDALSEYQPVFLLKYTPI